jgi:hypothetical protein
MHGAGLGEISCGSKPARASCRKASRYSGLAGSSWPRPSPLPCSGAAGAGLFGASLGRGDALFASDVGLQLVEVGHDLVVAAFEFGGAALVGVRLDFVQRFTRLRDETAALLLQLGGLISVS